MSDVAPKIRSRRAFRVPETSDFAEVEIELAFPISPVDGGRLLMEAVEARDLRVPGFVDIYDVQITRERVCFVLSPVDDGIGRLDLLARSVQASSTRSSAQIITSAIGWTERVAEALESLARFMGPNGPRVHGAVSSRAVLVSASAEVTLLLGSFSLLTELLVPPADSQLDALCTVAPEIIRGEAPCLQSDVFGLATILHELVTGRPYRRGWSEQALRSAAFSDADPDVPVALVDGSPMPAPLSEWLERALSADPEARFAHALAAREGLLDVLARLALSPPSTEQRSASVRSASASPRVMGPEVLGSLRTERSNAHVRGTTEMPAMELEELLDFQVGDGPDQTREMHSMEIAELLEFQMGEAPDDTEESPVPELAYQREAAFAESLGITVDIDVDDLDTDDQSEALERWGQALVVAAFVLGLIASMFVLFG